MQIGDAGREQVKQCSVMAQLHNLWLLNYNSHNYYFYDEKEVSIGHY